MKSTISTITASIVSLAAAQKPTSSPVPANQCCADTGVCDSATYTYQIPIINLAAGSPNTPAIDGAIDLLGDNIGDSPPITGWIGDEYSRFLEMPMYNGGRNGGNDRVGTAYIAYDCTNEIVCAAAHLDSSFLQANPTVSVQQDDDESFIRFGENNGAGRIRQSNSDEFAYIGTPENSNFIIGYEGCWSVNTIDESITNNFLEFHFNTSEGDTISTGRPAANGEFACVTPNCLTETPTASPNNIPPIGLLTPKPTSNPTSSPSANPSASPTSSSPTLSPSASPSNNPSQAPITQSPTSSPSQAPVTQSPTSSPSQAPITQSPTSSPSQAPSTQSPTSSPSQAPSTQSPTSSPSQAPSTQSPTRSPIVGTESPSVSVSPSTEMPSTEAPSTSMPSTQAPSTAPTSNPTNAPSQSPTTIAPTTSPSNSPSTAGPTNSPSSTNPSASPSSSPSSSPSCPVSQCVPEYGLCNGGCDRCCEGTTCVQVDALGERRCLKTDDICPSTSPTAAPTTGSPITRIAPPSSPAPSTSSAPTGVGSGLYVPNCFTGSGGPPVCIIDDGTYDLPAATPEWGTLEECCSGFYGWNYDQCMGNGPSGRYFPNWENVNIADGNVCVLDDGNHNTTKGTPKYDDLSTCCDIHYGWNLDECNGVVRGPSNRYFPNWNGAQHVCLLDNGSNVVPDSAPLYDDLASCCTNQYSWNLDECNAAAP